MNDPIIISALITCGGMIVTALIGLVAQRRRHQVATDSLQAQGIRFRSLMLGLINGAVSGFVILLLSGDSSSNIESLRISAFLGATTSVVAGLGLGLLSPFREVVRNSIFIGSIASALAWAVQRTIIELTFRDYEWIFYSAIIGAALGAAIGVLIGFVFKKLLPEPAT